MRKQVSTYFVDGGAKIEPPKYKFHNSYFTVLDEKGTLIHFAENIGDFYSGYAEYLGILWTILTFRRRPIKIINDCKVAIIWAKKGTRTDKFKLPPLNLDGVTLEFQSENLADLWNDKNGPQ
jgi:hypothetical protein